MTAQPILVNDERLEQIVEKTNGAINLCYQCGTCTATCPLGLVRAEPLTARKILRRAQIGAENGDTSLWLCTTCKLCETRCPRQVPIVDCLIRLRGLDFEAHRAPPRLEAALWKTYEDGDPWGGGAPKRGAWAEGLEVRDALRGVKVLLYVGCAAAHDPRLQRVSKAVTELLKAANVDFGILGSAEKCCGDTVNSLGETDFLEELIRGNIELFAKTGAEVVVSISPHCHNMFVHEYPRYGADFQALHYTQFFEQLLDEGKLRFASDSRRTVTYHDPCYLGRYQQEYEAPRKLLEAIPQLQLVEMADTRSNALCCGGGGGQMWMESDSHTRLSDLRVKQAADTEAQELVTSCPYCIQNFESSRTSVSAQGLGVFDLSELLARRVIKL